MQKYFQQFSDFISNHPVNKEGSISIRIYWTVGGKKKLNQNTLNKNW